MKLSEATRILSDAGIDSPRADAIALFCEIGGAARVDLIGRDAEIESDELCAAVMRRAQREPLQYIVGKVDFYRERYAVRPGVLIPRMDTEILVDYAVKHIPRGERFIDLCTGSGCVAISTLCNTDKTRAVCVDISDIAVKLCRENAAACGVADRAEIIRADAFDYTPCEPIFAMLSNPPYVDEAVYCGLEKEIFFEPREAFVGGMGGVEFYERLTPVYKPLIAPGGFIAYEIGYDQAGALSAIAEKNRMSCEIIRDLGGRDRVAVLKN